MAAKKGNNNAEKWTQETVLEAVEKMLSYIDANPKNYHIGSALVNCGYYANLWSYLSTKFKDNEIVLRAIKKTETILEARIINDALCGEIKGTAMAIFYLKNKHGYKDKTEVDQNTNVHYHEIETSPEVTISDEI